MADETSPKEQREERDAASEGRAETGPLTGTPGAASGLQPGGTIPGGGPGSTTGSIGRGGGSTVDKTTGNAPARGPQPNASRSSPDR